MRITLLFLCLTFGPHAGAQDGPSPTPIKDGAKASAGKREIALPPEKAGSVRIARLASAPTIDGRLDDEAWGRATILKDFYQIQPGDNIAPSKPAQVMLGYDSKHLYIGFRATDDRGQVRATVAKRDQIFDDDYFGFYLDTFNDRRRAYAAFFNPLGVQADGVFTEGNGEDYSIDIVMESKGVVTERTSALRNVPTPTNRTSSGATVPSRSQGSLGIRRDGSKQEVFGERLRRLSLGRIRLRLWRGQAVVLDAFDGCSRQPIADLLPVALKLPSSKM